jgi:hypothetical protein
MLEIAPANPTQAEFDPAIQIPEHLNLHGARLGSVMLPTVVEVGYVAPSEASTDKTAEVRKEVGPSVIEKLNENIDARSEQALKDIEFDSSEPQVIEAVHGFFTDHLTLKTLLSEVVEGNYPAELVDQILDANDYEKWEIELGSQSAFYENKGSYRPNSAPNAKVYSYRVAKFLKDNMPEDMGDVPDEKMLKTLKLCGVAVKALYRESSIGVSAVNSEDTDIVAELADRIIDRAGTTELFKFGPSNRGNFNSGDDMKRVIEAAKQAFWDDTRHPGQLLFHGSMDIGAINLFGIQSRNEQVRQTGNMNNTTALAFGGDTMHSVVPHFSEFYGEGQYANGDKAGTLATPLIKVIREAPFARDAEYGIVKLKVGSDADTSKVPSPTMDMPTSISGAGEPDQVGRSGRDRVFFASADETGDVLPDAYSIDLFDKSNKPATYVVMIGDAPQLHDLGYGFGFPERLFLDGSDGTDQAIRDLQQEYFDAYNKDRVVVPLRRGIFAQEFENVPSGVSAGRKKAVIYNKYTPGTGKPI